MKAEPRKPQDTGDEEDHRSSRQNKKISGSGHFAVQLMQSSKHLPNINEEKSNHFSRPFDVSEAKVDSERHLFGTNGNDKPRCDANKTFQMTHSPHFVKRPSGLGKAYLPEFYEVASISTMGNGSLFHNDREVPSNKRVSFETDEIQEQPWVIKQSPNDPHPLLEFPPLYWMIRNCPVVLETVKSIYQFRWSMSYPLQRRVFLSQYLKKAGIFCTYGELLLVIPMIGMTFCGILSTFVYPSAFWSGHAARLPLILALFTAMRNSIITLLIGLPFERALWYHKVLGRIAFFNGILHTIVAHSEALEKFFFRFIVYDQMNASGIGLLFLIAGVTITSLPQIRHWCFEVFYYIHIIFVSLMVVCAFYHSGILIPVLSAFYIYDILTRKIIMACCRYPRKARIRVLSDTVVELTFPKTAQFAYNAGQHLSIAVGELSLFEWHPFSIASSPRQKNVVILIRVVSKNSWTGAMHKLAKEKSEIDILVEGPNGSPNIDIFSDRYQSFLLFSGGIGITPIQSMCNQLVYEKSKGCRDLERIRLVWTERDPVVMEAVEVVRRGSSCHFEVPVDLEDLDLRSIASHSVFNDGQSTDIASTLLSLVPPSRRTDAELEQDYPIPDRTTERKVSTLNAHHAKKGHHGTDESTFRQAFNNPDVHEILDMQVYLTSKQANEALINVPFVHLGRPDVEQIFADMREEALESGLKRVAVIVCAPARLAHVLQVACVKYSDDDMAFDFHMEYQD